MLIIGKKVRVTNPKANPRYTVLALSRKWVKLSNPYSGRWYKLRRERIERLNP